MNAQELIDTARALVADDKGLVLATNVIRVLDATFDGSSQPAAEGDLCLRSVRLSFDDLLLV